MNPEPIVWYVAAGYRIPAGIEAHVLHYATEMRNHGFLTKVVVFQALPKEKHRFLVALEERNISIVSLYDASYIKVCFALVIFLVPWVLKMMTRGQVPRFASFVSRMRLRMAIGKLRKMLKDCQPDLVHVFGRLNTEALAHFSPKKTIYHEMMTGTVDSSWTQDELRLFREYAEGIARYFAPGIGVANNIHKCFGIARHIECVFTMCPDETENLSFCQARTSAKNGNLRFGILCRLVPQKGISYLLEAIKKYSDKYGTVDFTFAGFGPLRQDIEDFVERHDLNNVRIVSVKNAPEILGQIDVFVHPSLDDAMPVSIAEALMCGCPCIVCRVGGVADLVRDGREGMVIEPRRADQIFDSMVKFEEMPMNILNGFKQRARSRYEEKCLPQSVGKVVARHYKQILGL